MKYKLLMIIPLFLSFFLASCQKNEEDLHMKKTIQMMKDEKYDIKTVMNFEDAAQQKLKKIYENEIVSLSEINLKPGENIPVHKTGKRIIYSLNNSNLNIAYTTGKDNLELSTGEAYWQENMICRVVNTGSEDAKLLICERKEKKLPVGSIFYSNQNLTAMAPGLSKDIFANDYFTITKVNVPSYGEIPEYYANYMLVYPFDNCKVDIKSNKTDLENQRNYWYEPDRYFIKNQEKNDINFLVFQIKK